MLEPKGKKPSRRAARPKEAAPVRKEERAVRAPAPAREAGSAPLSPEQRRRMITEAAYFRAARRGFSPGDPVRDWLEAEAEIDALLLKRS